MASWYAFYIVLMLVHELVSEFFNFAIEKIKSYSPEIKPPDFGKIKEMVNDIIEKVLMKRLKIAPTSEQKKNLLDGERYEIGNQVAVKIGKFLDKALYTKFKSKK